MLPSLPEDVISEILSWVPVKPACRFRSVSKGWHALIASPAFLAVHKSRADPLFQSVTTSFPHNINSVLRLMDIDGNILRVIKKLGLFPVDSFFDGRIHVCINGHDLSVIDLATGNVVRITSPELNNGFFFDLNVGCAVPSRTYKVVFFKGMYGPCKVLTLEDGAKWRRVRSPPTPPLVTNDYTQCSPVTVNSVMHFLYKIVTLQEEEDYVQAPDYVLRFDLESEEWKASIKSPTRTSDKLHECKCLVKLRAALCLVQLAPINVCLISVLSDSAWVKMHTLPMDPAFDSWRPLTAMRDGRKLLFHTRDKLRKTQMLQVYDPLSGTFTPISEFASNLLGNF